MKLNQTMYDYIQQEQCLFARCCDCKHGQSIDPKKLISPQTWNMIDLAKHLTCSKCKSKNIQVTPAQTELIF